MNSFPRLRAVLLTISAAALCLLISLWKPSHIAMCACVVLIPIWRILGHFPKSVTPARTTFAILTAAVLSFIFLFYGYIAWSSAKDILLFPLKCIGLSSSCVRLLALGGLTCLSVYYLYVIALAIINSLSVPAESVSLCETSTKDNIRAILFCTVLSAGVLVFCTTCSFLYRMNEWNDVNCFFTVGKGMLHGLIPYKDLYEQKGPLLYSLHAVACLISETNYIGMYLIEVIALTVFLFFAYRTFRLYSGRGCYILTAVSALIICTSISFFSGDTAEEMSLPFLMYAFWMLADNLKRGRNLSLKQSFLIGLTSGCVFWIKFSLVGFYVGWFLVPAFLWIRKREFARMFTSIGMIILGVAAATIPYIVYFALNHAIPDWITAYILNNVFTYGASARSMVGIVKALYHGMEITIKAFFPIIPLTLATLLILVRDKETRLLSLAALCTFSFQFFTIFMGGKHYVYYPIALSCITVPGLIAVYRIFCPKNTDFRSPHTRIWPVIIPLISTILAFLLTWNGIMLGMKKEDYPQYRFAETIGQSEEQTLLNYGFLDSGFYMAADILPNCKAFCRLNIAIPELEELHNQWLAEAKCRFVVTRWEELDDPNYKLIDTASYSTQWHNFTFYLYERTSDNAL